MTKQIKSSDSFGTANSFNAFWQMCFGSLFNPLVPEFCFLILAHPVRKM
jgi:hypothetical protein